MKSTLLTLALVFGFSAPAWSAAHGGGGSEGPIGYGGVKIQMMPMMAPYKVGKQTRYEVLTIRLVLAPNPETERPACFMVPILHEKILLYLHNAKLTQADFSGQRLDVLREKLLEIAIANTDKSYFTDVEFLNDQSMLPSSGGSSAGASSGAAEKAVNAAKGDARIAQQRQEGRAAAGVSGGGTTSSSLDPRSTTLSSQCR